MEWVCMGCIVYVRCNWNEPYRLLSIVVNNLELLVGLTDVASQFRDCRSQFSLQPNAPLLSPSFFY